MTDESISGRIERLVAEEHALHGREQAEREDDQALAGWQQVAVYARTWATEHAPWSRRVIARRQAAGS